MTPAPSNHLQIYLAAPVINAEQLNLFSLILFGAGSARI